jgi:hypothetical protein
VTRTRGARPRTVAHRSDAPKSPQPRTFPSVLGVALIAGWALLAVAEGGQTLDPGDGLAGSGATAAFLALALGAPAVVAALGAAGEAAALRAGPTQLALTGMVGLAGWTAVSIVWSSAPDLSWIEANITLIALAALVAGIALGAVVPRAPVRLGVGLSLGAVLPVAWALATKVLPALAGADDRDLARLSAPLAYPNALALVAVIAVPGALWVAARPEGEGWSRARRPLAAAWLTAILVTLLLTYSRGGLIALAVAGALAVVWLRRPFAAVTALGAAALGAVWPGLYGLTADALTTDALPVAEREGAGLGLGWRLLLGMALAAGLAWATRERTLPVTIRPRRVAAALAASLALVVAAGGVAAAADGGVRGWVGDRVGLGDDGGAVSNESGRILDPGINQRSDWWTEAAHGFSDAPLLGQGGGTFPLVHLQYRDNGVDAVNPRDPHGLVLRVASGLGAVGLVFLAALVAGVARGSTRALRRGPRDAVALPLAVVAAVGVISIIDRTWAVPALTVPAFAAAGVLLAAAAPGRGRWRRRRLGPVPAAVGAALASIIVASALFPWWSGRAVASGTEALAESRPEEALEHAAAARARNPLSLAPLRLRALANADVGDRDASLRAYLDMKDLQPENPQAWELLALALRDDPTAYVAWTNVLKYDPQNAKAWQLVILLSPNPQAPRGAGGRGSQPGGGGGADEEPGGPPPARSGDSSSSAP